MARALAAIIALLAVGLAGFLFANNAAQISPSQVAPIRLTRRDRTEPVAPELTDLGLDDLASVVTIEAELENGAEESLGTGWIYDSLGDVVTNAHVINGDDTLRVTDRDDHTLVARVVQSDATADLAMLRVTGTLSGTPLPVDTRPLTTVPMPVITLASSRATGHGDMTPETLDRISMPTCRSAEAASRRDSPRRRSTTTCSTSPAHGFTRATAAARCSTRPAR